jgi:DUF971 family protein
MNTDEHLFPQSIVDHQASGVLQLVWQDGRADGLPHALLRSCCRCAGCEQQRRQTGTTAEAAASIRLVAIELVGDKGLNLVFSDNHGRGIYPWAYLRQIGRQHSGSREIDVPGAIADQATFAHA